MFFHFLVFVGRDHTDGRWVIRFPSAFRIPNRPTDRPMGRFGLFTRLERKGKDADLCLSSHNGTVLHRFLSIRTTGYVVAAIMDNFRRYNSHRPSLSCAFTFFISLDDEWHADCVYVMYIWYSLSVSMAIYIYVPLYISRPDVVVTSHLSLSLFFALFFFFFDRHLIFCFPPSPPPLSSVQTVWVTRGERERTTLKCRTWLLQFLVERVLTRDKRKNLVYYYSTNTQTDTQTGPWFLSSSFSLSQLKSK